MKKRSKIILYLVLLAFIAPIAILLGRSLYYAYNTGPRSGQVVDAESGQPIEGTVVVFQWCTRGSWGLSQFFLSAEYETTTDKQGRYYIPNQSAERETLFMESLQPETVVVFKHGYAAYGVWDNEGRSFWWGNFPQKQPYQPINNLVKLIPWQSGPAAKDQLEWINSRVGFGMLSSELLLKEMQKEKIIETFDLKKYFYSRKD